MKISLTVNNVRASASSGGSARGLAGVEATKGEYARVAPGHPDHSWLYLNASGGASSASCGPSCDERSMPPGAMGVAADQPAILRQEIMAGAPIPSNAP
ncbi:hypothetical protein WMF30_44845 [Sorangium sp. So ce134]